MRKNGFTLIEILIAISIFAIVSVITSSVLLSAVKTSKHIETNTQTLKKIQETVITIRKDLSNVINNPSKESKNNFFSFAGLSHELQFTTIDFHSFLTQKSPFKHIIYILNQHQIIRIALKNNEERREILLSQINNLEMSYLDSKNHFQQKWSDPSELPKAVLFHINSQTNGNFNLLIPLAYANEKSIHKP